MWVWLPEVARLLYFFHPVAYYVCFRARLERELACDELAIAHGGGDVGQYAQTLVQVAGG